MTHVSKRFKSLRSKVDSRAVYPVGQALTLLKEGATAKFDETIDLAVRLGVDPKRSDQQVRGTVSLPAGSGQKVRVAVISRGDKNKEAEAAGADTVGSEDLIEKIQKGWLDFDVLIATPDVMAAVGKLGKVLGQKGLMPNPKSGTVTTDVAQTVKSFKAGRVEFRVDKGGVLHLVVGKMSFEVQKIQDNLKAALDAIQRLKPPSAKGVYLRSVTLSSSMGPGISLDPREFAKEESE